MHPLDKHPLDKRKGLTEKTKGWISVLLVGVPLLLGSAWLVISLIRWMWEHTLF